MAGYPCTCLFLPRRRGHARIDVVRWCCPLLVQQDSLLADCPLSRWIVVKVPRERDDRGATVTYCGVGGAKRYCHCTKRDGFSNWFVTIFTKNPVEFKHVENITYSSTCAFRRCIHVACASVAGEGGLKPCAQAHPKAWRSGEAERDVEFPRAPSHPAPLRSRRNTRTASCARPPVWRLPRAL